jgi:hypothetical protein
MAGRNGGCGGDFVVGHGGAVKTGAASAPIGRPPLHVRTLMFVVSPHDIGRSALNTSTDHCHLRVFVLRLPQHKLRHRQLLTGLWPTRPLPRQGPPLQRRPRSKGTSA